MLLPTNNYPIHGTPFSHFGRDFPASGCRAIASAAARPAAPTPSMAIPPHKNSRLFIL